MPRVGVTELIILRPEIGDACQAMGVTYKGHRVGTIGEVGALCYNQFKNLNLVKAARSSQ